MSSRLQVSPIRCSLVHCWRRFPQRQKPQSQRVWSKKHIRIEQREYQRVQGTDRIFEVGQEYAIIWAASTFYPTPTGVEALLVVQRSQIQMAAIRPSNHPFALNLVSRMSGAGFPGQEANPHPGGYALPSDSVMTSFSTDAYGPSPYSVYNTSRAGPRPQAGENWEFHTFVVRSTWL